MLQTSTAIQLLGQWVQYNKISSISTVLSKLEPSFVFKAMYDVVFDLFIFIIAQILQT